MHIQVLLHLRNLGATGLTDFADVDSVGAACHGVRPVVDVESDLLSEIAVSALGSSMAFLLLDRFVLAGDWCLVGRVNFGCACILTHLQTARRRLISDGVRHRRSSYAAEGLGDHAWGRNLGSLVQDHARRALAKVQEVVDV